MRCCWTSAACPPTALSLLRVGVTSEYPTFLVIENLGTRFTKMCCFYHEILTLNFFKFKFSVGSSLATLFLSVTLLEVYRSMALSERKRMDGPPRGGAVPLNDFRNAHEWVTRADIEAIIGSDHP